MKKKIKEAGIFIAVCVLIFLSGWLILGRSQEYGTTNTLVKAGTSFEEMQELYYLINDAVSGNQPDTIKKALKALDYFIRTDKKNTELYSLKGVLLYQAKRYKEAAKSFGKAVKYNPGFIDGYAGQGLALLQTGKYKQAAEALKKAYALDENNITALYGLAGASIMSGNLSDALRYIEEYAGNYQMIYEADHAKWTAALDKASDRENAQKVKTIIEEKLRKVDNMF